VQRPRRTHLPRHPLEPGGRGSHPPRDRGGELDRRPREVEVRALKRAELYEFRVRRHTERYTERDLYLASRGRWQRDPRPARGCSTNGRARTRAMATHGSPQGGRSWHTFLPVLVSPTFSTSLQGHLRNAA
jgi:hypothetical protein